MDGGATRWSRCRLPPLVWGRRIQSQRTALRITGSPPSAKSSRRGGRARKAAHAAHVNPINVNLTCTSTGLADASDAQTKAADKVKAEAAKAVGKPFALEGIRDHLHDNIADERWHSLSMRCISCGTCTYVCPSCYCFSINDEIAESSGERYRVWDNCFNPMYTEETSGHNPRAQKSNRFRNRFSHKFWYYPDKYDSLLCSGCGRCISNCPTRIDIREVLTVMGTPAPKVAEGKGA